MNSFEEMAASRRDWIDNVLTPWCRQASRVDLLKAEPEWNDIAGKVDPVKTLWLWAWSRFPDLVHESLGIEETSEVEVELADGRRITGFPDSRLSQRGHLYILGSDSTSARLTELGPFSIDDVVAVHRRPGRGSTGCAIESGLK